MNNSLQKFGTIIGIDPGVSGGIAVYKIGEPITVHSMPKTEGDTLYLLRDLTEDPGSSVAFVESVGGYVGKAQPACRAFTFGRGYGFVLGVLQERGVRVELVLPRTWQKHFNLGTATACATRTIWKAKLRAEAQRRYPSIKVTLSVADAILLLDYGLAVLRAQPGQG